MRTWIRVTGSFFLAALCTRGSDSQLSERDYVPGTGTSTVGSLLTVAMTLLAFRFVLCGSFAILMS